MEEVATFLAVFEEGGINAAARRLGHSRSAVSKRIVNLEAALSIALFVRSTTKMTPTDAGSAFYEKAAPLVAGLEDAANDVRGQEHGLSGTLRITAPVSLTLSHLSDAITAFCTDHPELKVVIDLNDRTIDLTEGGYDLAIRIGRLPDSSLRARTLRDSPRLLCGSPAYLAATGVPKAMDELSAHRTIGYDNVHAASQWRFSVDGLERSVTVQPSFVSNNGETMRAAALAGLGLVLLPSFLVETQIADGTLVAIDLDGTPLPDTIQAVYTPSKEASPKVRAFIDHLVEAFGGL